MSIVVTSDAVPLQADADGVIRVGGTRVTLDTVVVAFHQGMTPEAIAEQYTTVSLADIYATIGYYLRHYDAVQAYLAERRLQAGAVQRQNESAHPPLGIRDRLLARRPKQD